MPRAVNLIVSCTSRKRYEVLPGLAVCGIGANDLPTRLGIWEKRLHQVAAVEHPADEVYMGDHWSVVRSIPEEASKSGLNVRIWVCSAGYGLIQRETPIKAYRATFARGENDYVASGLAEDEHTLCRWWRGICSYRFSGQSKTPRSIAELATAFPGTPLIVALSADYLKAVGEDLAQVLFRSYFKEHLAIISCGTPKTHPTWKQNLLPCDGSLAANLGGTLTSLNIRVARRLLQSIERSEVTIETLARLANSLERRAQSPLPSRGPTTDSDVAAFIRSHLTGSSNISKTRLLREFRGNGRSCEQKRFAGIYLRVRQEVVPELYV